jgi:hypothetical protein
MYSSDMDDPTGINPDGDSCEMNAKEGSVPGHRQCGHKDDHLPVAVQCSANEETRYVSASPPRSRSHDAHFRETPDHPYLKFCQLFEIYHFPFSQRK